MGQTFELIKQINNTNKGGGEKTAHKITKSWKI